MKVISKFLTADVRITAVAYKDGQLEVQGLVKEFMPMTVQVGFDDLREMLQLVASPWRRRLAAQLPAALMDRLPLPLRQLLAVPDHEELAESA